MVFLFATEICFYDFVQKSFNAKKLSHSLSKKVLLLNRYQNA